MDGRVRGGLACSKTSSHYSGRIVPVGDVGHDRGKRSRSIAGNEVLNGLQRSLGGSSPIKDLRKKASSDQTPAGVFWTEGAGYNDSID